MAKTKKNGEPRKHRTMTGISAEDFVKAWQKAESVKDAQAKLGPGASGRAASLRAAGVQLKKFTPGRRLDIDALNALV